MRLKEDNPLKKENEGLKSENKQLREKIKVLEKELMNLRKKVAFFENHPSISDGIRGESLVASLVNGLIIGGCSPYDVISNRDVRIEVKFSRLNVVGQTTKRWNWAKPFGGSGNKVYDRLLLIGEKDDRYTDLYLDPQSPYILFDVPFKEVSLLTTKASRHGFAGAHITLTTNPRKAKSRASLLFRDYQITEKTLKEKYTL